MTDASDIGTMLDGVRLAGVLPYVEEQLAKQMDGCIARMDRLLTEGKLTPEMSQMAWIELLAYRRLSRNLSQKVRIGLAAGEKVAPLLNGEPPLPT